MSTPTVQESSAQRLLPEPAPAAPRWPSSPRRTAILVIISATLGLGSLALTIITYAHPPAELDLTPEKMPDIVRQIAVSTVLGIAALIALPFTLRHGEGEARSADAVPGPRSALIAGIVTVTAGMSSELGFVAGVIALISLVSRRSIAWTVTGVAALVAGVTLSFLIQDTSAAVDPLIWIISTGILVLGTVIALTIGLVRGQRRERHWRLVERAEASETFVHAREASARADERLRISRDMHDSLSHRLSLIAVHAGAVEYRDDLDLETVRREIGTIREQAEFAVEDLRSVLTALREDDQGVDPRTSIDLLVDSARRTGMEVSLDIDPEVSGALSQLPTLSGHAVHRMVQECLTNARKHAPGEPVAIRLDRVENRLVIRVSNPLNPGSESSGHRGEPGYGLVGLGERARLIGGLLSVDRETSELVVILEVPWTEQP